MANDHVIDVVVRADTTGLSAGLSHAEQDLGRANGAFSRHGAEMEKVGRGAAIMGGAILAGVGLAVHAYSEFSSRMAQVQSLSHASSAEMDVLAQSALSMGTAFGLSANDVADAEIELVKAGVSVKEMLGGALPGALALAAAGQIDVGKATEIATIALTQFNLKGKDVPHVADLLAAGADKALGGVQELGDGLKQGGLVASQFGLTIDDTVGTLSAFANAGLLGSDAGTSMKTMFLALASPSKQAQAALDQYNITAYDAQGKFKGVADLAGQLHDKLGPLSDAQRNAALSTIFGTDAMRSAAVLMKEGSTGIRKWISDVNDQGFAATQAAGKMDSLNGDMKKLQAAFETGLIKMGATSDGFLRPVIKAITDAITAFGSMPEPMKGVLMGVAAVSGGALLLGGALLTVIPKIGETISSFRTLTTNAPRVAGALGTIGKAAGIAAAAMIALQVIGNLSNLSHDAAPGVEAMSNSLMVLARSGKSVNEVFNKETFASAGLDNITDIGKAMKDINTHDISRFGNDLMKSVTGYESGVHLLEKAVTNIDAAMANLNSSGSFDVASGGFKKIAEEAKKQGVTVEDTAKSFPQYMDSLRKLSREMKVDLNDQELLNWALGEVPQKMLDAQNSTEGQAKAAEIAAQATEKQQKALDELGISADGTILHLDKLVTSMIASGLISLSAKDAARNFEKSLEDLDTAIGKNGTTLDISTQKGRDNEAAFDGIAGAGLRSAEAMAKNGDAQPKVQKQLEGTYWALIKAAEKFGITGDDADTMARQVMGIPKDVPIETAIKNYADTMAKAQSIKQAVESIQGKSVDVVINHINRQVAGGGSPEDPSSTALDPSVLRRADGGAIYGHGAKGVDSVRAFLAPGEHVLSDSDVDAMGGQAGVYAFRKQLHNGGVRPMYGAAAPAAPVMAMAGGGDSGPTQMTGTLVMDSGEILGVFHGIATRAVTSGMDQVATTAGGRR